LTVSTCVKMLFLHAADNNDIKSTFWQSDDIKEDFRYKAW